MKQSTCGAVFCQPGGDELKHDNTLILPLSWYLNAKLGVFPVKFCCDHFQVQEI